MEITRNGTQPSAQGPADWFHRHRPHRTPSSKPTRPARATAALVTFRTRRPHRLAYPPPRPDPHRYRRPAAAPSVQAAPSRKYAPATSSGFSARRKNTGTGAAPTTAMSHLATQEKQRRQKSSIGWSTSTDPAIRRLAQSEPNSPRDNHALPASATPSSPRRGKKRFNRSRHKKATPLNPTSPLPQQRLTQRPPTPPPATPRKTGRPRPAIPITRNSPRPPSPSGAKKHAPKPPPPRPSLCANSCARAPVPLGLKTKSGLQRQRTNPAGGVDSSSEIRNSRKSHRPF